MNVCRAEHRSGNGIFRSDVAAQQSISGSDYKPEPAGSQMIDNVKSAQKWTPCVRNLSHRGPHPRPTDHRRPLIPRVA